MPENLLKYLHINFQIWFPKYQFKNPKYIKNVEVHSLRTPALKYHRTFLAIALDQWMKLKKFLKALE